MLRQLADGVSREIVVLVGAPDWEQARAAAQRFGQATGAHPELLRPVDKIGAFDFDAALAFYRPWREHLLTDAQRAMLGRADADTLAQQALARLYQFSAGASLSGWSADPLGLWQDWWLARADMTRVRERDGLAAFSADGLQWVLLTYRIGKPAFSVSGDTDYGDLLAAAAHLGSIDLAALMPLLFGREVYEAHGKVGLIGL